jgi:hypothetical protein
VQAGLFRVEFYFSQRAIVLTARDSVTDRQATRSVLETVAWLDGLQAFATVCFFTGWLVWLLKGPGRGIDQNTVHTFDEW